MPDPLAAALARLDRAFVAARHPLATALQPGLPAQDISRLVEPTGLTLPEEAVALWGWHNGVDPSFTKRPRPSGAELLPGGAYFMSLDQAVETFVWFRENNPWCDLDDLSPEWFPAARFGHPAGIWIDCSRAPTEPAPIIQLEHDDIMPPEEVARRTLPSVTEAVNWWAYCLESGQWVLHGGSIWTAADDAEPHPWM